MKTAISHWQGRIAPVFDVARRVSLVDTQDRRIVGREEVYLQRKDVWGRANELADMGVERLICGAVSQSLEKALVHAGIQVTGFMCGEFETVLSALRNDRLHDKRLRMPGFGPADTRASVPQTD